MFTFKILKFNTLPTNTCFKNSFSLRIKAQYQTVDEPSGKILFFFYFFFYGKNLLYFYFFFPFFFEFYFIFKLYITVLVLPNIKVNPPQVYMCSPF